MTPQPKGQGDEARVEVEGREQYLPGLIAKTFGTSLSEGRRLIAQGAVRLNGRVVPGDKLDVKLAESGGSELMVGKRRVARVYVTSGDEARGLFEEERARLERGFDPDGIFRAPHYEVRALLSTLTTTQEREARLMRALADLIDEAAGLNAQVEQEFGLSSDPDYGVEPETLRAARAALDPTPSLQEEESHDYGDDHEVIEPYDHGPGMRF